MYWYPKFPAGWWLNGETTSIEQPMYRWYQTDRCSFHWKDILAMNGVDQERSSSSQTFLSLWKMDHFSQIHPFRFETKWKSLTTLMVVLSSIVLQSRTCASAMFVMLADIFRAPAPVAPSKSSTNSSILTCERPKSCGWAFTNYRSTSWSKDP